MSSALFSGIVVVGALFAPACFHPKYDHATCGPNGECPSGQRCSPQGTCEKDDGVDASPVPGLKARWMLADGPGTTTASDMLGAHPATIIGAVTWSQDPDRGVTAVFDGSSGYLATLTPVMTTNASYTVSAWVKLTNPVGQHTVLSQSGNSHSPFYLQYDDGVTNTWRLTISAADASGTALYNATSTSSPQVGVWTHLVGVYDSAAKTAKLYVNGQVQNTADVPATWNSTGATWIGRSKSTSTWWQGNLSDVQIYSRALSATEVTNL